MKWRNLDDPKGIQMVMHMAGKMAAPGYMMSYEMMNDRKMDDMSIEKK